MATQNYVTQLSLLAYPSGSTVDINSFFNVLNSAIQNHGLLNITSADAQFIFDAIAFNWSGWGVNDHSMSSVLTKLMQSPIGDALSNVVVGNGLLSLALGNGMQSPNPLSFNAVLNNADINQIFNIQNAVAVDIFDAVARWGSSGTQIPDTITQNTLVNLITSSLPVSGYDMGVSVVSLALAGKPTLVDAILSNIDVNALRDLSYYHDTTLKAHNIDIGTHSNDVQYGSRDADTIFGLDGNDTIKAGNGDDTIVGGYGSDLIYGGRGDDVIWTNQTTAYNVGPVNGHDVAKGGFGNDTIFAGTGNDRLYGDDGHDSLYSVSGNDYLNGGAGNDKLFAGSGDDKLYGGTGNDVLVGETGKDYLNGGDGSDILNGGADADTLVGGAGNDVFVFDSQSIGSRDTIADFNLALDSIDISDLLSGFDPVQDSIHDFVTLKPSGSNTILSVDIDGTGNQFQSSAIALIKNVSLDSSDLDTLVQDQTILV